MLCLSGFELQLVSLGAPVTVTEFDVLYALTNLNPRKAAGPDDIGNWLLREYAEILVQQRIYFW